MTDLLLTAALAAHLMMVNLAMTGPLYAVWLERRGRRRSDPMPFQAGEKIAKASWHALMGAMVVGIAAALILHIPGEEWFQELMLMPRGRVHAGVAELLFSLVLMVIYAKLWKSKCLQPVWVTQPPKKWQLWGHRSLAILAATNLMYHFPTFFVIFSKFRDEGKLQPGLTSVDYRSMILDPEVMARSTHYLLASIAMSGVVVMLLALKEYKERDGDDETAPPQRVAIIAARSALVATILQLPVGFWVFVKVPARDRQQLMGDDMLAGALMLGGILSAVMILHALASVALGEADRSRIRASALWMLLTIVLMTGVLVRLRQPGPIMEEEEARLAPATQRVAAAPLGVVTPTRVGDEQRHDERMTQWEWRQSESLTRSAVPRRRSHRS